MFDAGDQVWFVMLNEVTPAVVTETFEIDDRQREFGKTTRYWVKKSEGHYGVFGKYDFGQTVFRTEEEANSKAEANLQSGEFFILDPAVLEIVELDAWVISYEKSDKQGYCVVALARLGENWCVYRKDTSTYQFMVEYESEQKARKAYKEEITEHKRNFQLSSVKSVEKASFMPIPLYGTGDGRWAQCEYAYNHYIGNGYHRRCA